MENEDSLNDKINKSIKTFEGIAETFDCMIRPPTDLSPQKRGICVCLGIGTIGLIGLAYFKASGYAYASEALLVIVAAVLVGWGKNNA